VQVVCGSFFIYDIITSIFGLRVSPLNWRLRELIEISAIAGLLLGSILGFMALRRTETRMQKAESQVRLASGAGTIKAQTNAIYRKANVSGRPQLMSLFVEELIADDHR